MISKVHAFLRFFTSSQSTSMKMNLLHTIREQWHEELKNTNQLICYSVKQARLLRNSLSSSMRQYFASVSAVNQKSSINKNSKSSNSRSLRQHTPAKSISLCCFCFCLVLRNRSFHHTNNQIFSRTRFSTRFSFSWSFHIFSVFALLLLLSHLSFHVYRICSETFSFNHDQPRIYASVNEFLRNVDR